MKKIKISQLPVATTLKGLVTVGVDENNLSVQVPLGFVEEETQRATGIAEAAAEEAIKAAEAANQAVENMADIVNNKFVVISSTEYDALEEKDDTVFYYVYED